MNFLAIICVPKQVSLSLLALSRQPTEIPPEKFHSGMSYWYVLSDEFSRESIHQSETLQISTVLSHQNEMSQVDRISEVYSATGEKLSMRKQKSIQPKEDYLKDTLLSDKKPLHKNEVCKTSLVKMLSRFDLFI